MNLYANWKGAVGIFYAIANKYTVTNFVNCKAGGSLNIYSVQGSTTIFAGGYHGYL